LPFQSAGGGVVGALVVLAAGVVGIGQHGHGGDFCIGVRCNGLYAGIMVSL
jgi:hypothetical protein